jgi:hypothetical protein
LWSPTRPPPGQSLLCWHPHRAPSAACHRNSAQLLC